MKLLIDENLAPRLADDLTDLFPGSLHVSSANLGGACDEIIWNYAKANGFTMLTKDKDFASLGIVGGPPPKTVLLQTGNCSTSEVENIVRKNAIRLAEFERGKHAILILK